MPQPPALPGCQQLSETPDMVRALLEGLTGEQALAKTSPEELSIAEILELLSHSESHGFRLLFDSMISEDSPALPTYDARALSLAGQYSHHDPEDSLAHWEEQREDNLAWLDSLPAEAVGRIGQHARWGRISVAQLLNAWAFHDLRCLARIVQIVGRLRYYPQMGPLQAQE